MCLNIVFETWHTALEELVRDLESKTEAAEVEKLEAYEREVQLKARVSKGYYRLIQSILKNNTFLIS